jgi:hypothetical protein
MLSDYLEIPNLQQKSKDYLLGLIKRHVFRIKSQQPLPPVVAALVAVLLRAGVDGLPRLHRHRDHFARSRGRCRSSAC